MTPVHAHAFLRSSLGLKIVMALTGVILFGFVIGHMLGNLQVYLGPEAFNAYAASLRALGHGTLLWVARGGLLIAALLHIWSAWRLTVMNNAARAALFMTVRRQADQMCRSAAMSRPPRATHSSVPWPRARRDAA